MHWKRLTAVARIIHSSGKHQTLHTTLPFPLVFFRPKISSYWKEEPVQDAGTSPRHPWRPQSTHLCIKHRWHVFIWLCTSYRIASYFSRPFLSFVMLIIKSKACLQLACSSSWPCTQLPVCDLHLFASSQTLQKILMCPGPCPHVICFSGLTWNLCQLFLESGFSKIRAATFQFLQEHVTIVCYLKISGEIQGQIPYRTHAIRHLLLFSLSAGFWYCQGKNTVTWVV